MAYNKVFFHVAANNAGRGLSQMYTTLDTANIPFAVYSADDAGVVAEAAQYKNATLIFRNTAASTVNPADYNTPPAVAAPGYWARHLASLPPEIIALKGRVWLELLNEPGREPAQAQWVGAMMVEMARRALAQGWRVMGPGWAPGNPEIEAWRYPGWVEYLELCAARPDAVAVSLHEYSLSNDIHAGENWLVGRFVHLFEACDALKIARPNTYVTEAGWTLNSAPPVEQMKNDVAWMSSLYARYPQIKSAHLWTMQGGRGNGDLPAKLSEIVPWLTEWTLRQRWPDPPTPPTEELMILDLSKWNGTLDAAKAKQNGITGVILRASYGTTRDEMVTEYAARLKAAGIPVIGCYHYYHPWQPMQPQLDTFIAAARAIGARRGYLDLEDMRFTQVAALEQMDDDAPPDVLRAANAVAMRNLGINPDATAADDLYEPALEAVAMSAAQPQLIEAARQFMAGLSTALPLPAGKRHGIYSNYSYIGAILGNAAFMAQYDLWLAAWTIAAAPAVPSPWSRWTLWQYSNSGNGPAYGLQSARVDLNRFNGTTAQFAEWLKIEDAPVDVAAAIRSAAAPDRQPPAGWHPAHALPLAIIRDGYLPVGPEFDATAGGVTYRALRAFDRTGKVWIYYAPVPRWNEVTRIAA